VTTIKTETAKSWDIPNRQHMDLVGNEESLSRRFQALHGAELRTRATGRYNCHGLTFASRRTCIEDAAVIEKILEDDNYVPVAPEQVRPGDVVIYYDDGVISHSGIVVEVLPESKRWPKVVSKWGPNGAEFLHWVHRSEYGQDYKYFRIDCSSETAIVRQIILGR
jgi:hypothetical protein